MVLTGIQACVFDAYGTLFDIGAAAARCRDRLGDKADTLSQMWRTKQIEYTWQRSLRGDYEDFWHVTAQGLDYAMAALGLADDVLRARLMEVYFALDAYPEVGDALRRLKAGGMKLAILSNGTPSMLIAAVRRSGLEGVFDSILSADEVRMYKPHPSVYRLATDNLRFSADSICFLSSNGWDAAGAAFFGLRVVWINRFGQPPERLDGTPERVITSLSELPPLLGL
jgi:2-haloacid dehalogenase